MAKVVIFQAGVNLESFSSLPFTFFSLSATAIPQSENDSRQSVLRLNFGQFYKEFYTGS